MKIRSGNEIRELWLQFWKEKQHDIIESAPLIPMNDPTLLWINAGVTPLKKYFDGSEIPNNPRMANVQKSIRTNDIDNVGRTARHHTFFEMLGNFSIGDYFRKEALAYAFEVLTEERWFGFDLDKLYFTVYPNDQETIDLWVKLGVDPSHIIPVAGNFWEIGEGPCGPDTEIFYDRGAAYDPENKGIQLIADDTSNERYIEIWNIVFSQYNAKKGVARSQYKELPNKNIDTGMGLERMACVIQGTTTNYETDLFMPIIKACSVRTKVEYQGQMAFKVIADHLRSVVFALSDGAMFSNEGRGYVLRRLLRRATRFARTLGMNEAFLYELVDAVVDNMQSFYGYLVDKQELVKKQIRIEEEKFLMTLESGEKKLLDYIKQGKTNLIEANMAFLLYDTFGFPFELTVEVAQEQQCEVDEKGFYDLLKQQKNRARQARNENQSMNTQNQAMMTFKEDSLFVGYTSLVTTSKVIALFQGEKRVQKAKGTLVAVFDQSGFYAESGGQIGDVGTLSIHNKNYSVSNTFKLPNGQHGLIIEMQEDSLAVGDEVTLAVDEGFRSDVAKNHSATHLLNETLRKVVGPHVIQQGSQVSNHLLRFDFNNFEPLSPQQILDIEAYVNQAIVAGYDVHVDHMALDVAKNMQVQAVFGEKYGDIVRVVQMEDSKELCGGTHVHNTSDIEKFVVLSVETKGSGIYRIEATTGMHIETELEHTVENLKLEIANIRSKIDKITEEAKENNIALEMNEVLSTEWIESYAYVLGLHEELRQLKEASREYDKQLSRKKREKDMLPLDDFINQKETFKDYHMIVTRIDDIDIAVAKDLVDRLSDYMNKSIIFVAIVSDGKYIFVCKSKIASLHAGNLVKTAAQLTDGNGGGRPDFAQAGGKDINKVDEALMLIRQTIKETV